MPTSPHRRVQSDATAKRRRSRVQRASEAPDGQTTTYPGTMPVAFARMTVRDGFSSSTVRILGCRRVSRL